MMGGAKHGAATAVASTAGSRREVGTIAEAAAIARAAAERGPAPQAVPPRETRRDRNQHRTEHRAHHSDGTAAVTGHQDDDSEAKAGLASRAAGGEPVDDADKTAAHLILAERAYAYGRSIVEAGPEPKKSETVAIKS